MREEMTERDGPIEAHRPLFEGLSNMIIHGRSPKLSGGGRTDWD